MARSAFARTIQLQLDKYSPEQARIKHIEIARKGFAAFYARQEVKPEYTLEVDGHPATSEDEVKQYGIIVYKFNRLGEVAQFALDVLIVRVRKFYPGKDEKSYINNFFVGINGKFIDAEDFDPKLVPPRAEIIIGNKVPFNRKLDVQRVGGEVLSFKIPAGLFDLAALVVTREYGKIVTVKRSYNIQHPDKHELIREQEYLSGPRKGKSRKRAGTLVESPGLVIVSRV